MTAPPELRYRPEDPTGFIDALWQAVPAAVLAGVIHLAGDRRQIRVQPADQRVPALILFPGQVVQLVDLSDPSTWQVIDGPVGSIIIGQAG